jgi:hypothetical protein
MAHLYKLIGITLPITLILCLLPPKKPDVKTLQYLQKEIHTLWENQLKECEFLEKKYQYNNPPPNLFPQEKIITLRHNGWELPIILRTNTKTNAQAPLVLYTGLSAPEEVLKTMQDISTEKTMLLYPNSPETQNILAFGFPKELPIVDSFPKIKLTEEN